VGRRARASGEPVVLKLQNEAPKQLVNH
jgi:hypothetical protein